MANQLSDKRRQALLELIPEEQVWGSLVRFLDSVDSLEELQALSQLFRKRAKAEDLWLLSYYEQNLVRWPKPELGEAFMSQFPLVSERLNSTTKIRIFLRAVEARRIPGDVMAKMFEELLELHEIRGELFIHYPSFRGNDFYTALRILYHTQLQYWTVCELILGGSPRPWCCRVTYCSGPEAGLHVVWDRAAWEAKFGNW